MGGRREVTESPAVELLKFMDMQLEKEEQEAEKERARAWIQYLISVFTQPSYGKEDPQFKKARQEFVNALQPVQREIPTKSYEWDFEKIERLRLMQEGG